MYNLTYRLPTKKNRKIGHKKLENAGLSKLYDGVYKKSEQKHFTTFLAKGKPSSEHLKILELFSWKGKKVIDVGCGTGLFAYLAAKKGAEVTGIDFSEQAIKLAQRNHSHRKLHFKKMNVNELKGKFDVIVSIGTLEHVDKPLDSLKFFKKHLSPNGKIIITSPNWTNPRGYVLMTIYHLFNAPITLFDLHYLTPIDFINWSKSLGMKLKWKTFDDSWAQGETLLKDFKRRLPKVCEDISFRNKEERINSLLKWIKKNILPFENSLPHSGAIGLYIFSSN